MNFSAKMLSLLAAISLVPPTAADAQTPNPGYFMPPADPAGNVSSRAIPKASPVIDDQLLDSTLPPTIFPKNPGLPWYDTDWGVAGIGIAATGLAALADRGINRFGDARLSPRIKSASLHAADVLELAPLAFSLATMLQSPVTDPLLAHASSIAITSAVAVTILSMGLKYAIGRNRPVSAASNPYVFHSFDPSRSSFSLGAVFPDDGSPTSSFPSGHTALAFALITPYAELYHQPLLYAIPVAVGLGRIVAQDGHWASDVVGGGFIGWLTADLTRRFFPQSDFGLMIFGDGRTEEISVTSRF